MRKNKRGRLKKVQNNDHRNNWPITGTLLFRIATMLNDKRGIIKLYSQAYFVNS